MQAVYLEKELLCTAHCSITAVLEVYNQQGNKEEANDRNDHRTPTDVASLGAHDLLCRDMQRTVDTQWMELTDGSTSQGSPARAGRVDTIGTTRR